MCTLILARIQKKHNENRTIYFRTLSRTVLLEIIYNLIGYTFINLTQDKEEII